MHENTQLKLKWNYKPTRNTVQGRPKQWRANDNEAASHQPLYPINAKTKENSSLIHKTHYAVNMSTNTMYTFIHHLHKLYEINTQWSCYGCHVHHQFNTASTVHQTEINHTFYVYGSVHHDIFYEITKRCSYMQSILFHC